MELSGWDKETSPFHPGEAELQDRLGLKEKQERIGRQILRPFMPQQHQDFFAQLPFIVAGSVDPTGAPWASILFGQPGFVSAPDYKTVVIETAFIPGDPIAQSVEDGAPVSFVGIELPTRRRNRFNGVVRSLQGSTLSIDIVQSFGNCPQYIHTRDMTMHRDPRDNQGIEVEQFTDLQGNARAIVAKADALFVASNNDRDDKRVNGGVDVNHRGGNAGFVKIDGNTLTVPDFIGNFAFNTLGNFLVNPKAGLLFIDFDTGDLVQLTGTVELLWEPDEDIEAFQGAERAWRFHLSHGHRLKAAAPLRWTKGEISPNTKLTGDWDQAAQTREARASAKAWRPFRVVKIEDESSVVRSFYLEPADGKGTLPYHPGQYLTINITPDAVDTPLIRTYTLSSAPSDPHYRISVKREDARGDAPAGRVSSCLHHATKVGDLIDVRAPNGAFWMDTGEKRPAVLIAGGVGITPMISMARQAKSDGFARRHLRQVTVIHSAQTTQDRAFADEFGALQKAAEGGIRYVSLIEKPAKGEKAGQDFDHEGRLSPQILQSHLPLADYDFYLCGPPAFMQAAYDMLVALGVADTRIFAEAFGPASLERIQPTTPTFTPVDEAIVTFEASGVEQVWTPQDGTLLELAEAHGLTPTYGCKSGACGSCAVKLKSGAVGYRTTPTFQADADEVLICCAVPAQSDAPLKLDL